MTASFTPAGAAEFPNDNPALHNGARWVCGAALGPPRALWRAPIEGAASATLRATAPPAPRLESSPFPKAPPSPPPALPAHHLEGPLELDLHRIVLRHRVEDVPPPPPFIYRPFVSRARAAPSASELPASESPASGAPAPSPRPIEPRPCRVVDTREACRRVQRGLRVDVAPCVHVGAGERRSGRHRGGMVASSVVASPARLPVADRPELQAASA